MFACRAGGRDREAFVANDGYVLRWQCARRSPTTFGTVCEGIVKQDLQLVSAGLAPDVEGYLDLVLMPNLFVSHIREGEVERRVAARASPQSGQMLR